MWPWTEIEVIRRHAPETERPVQALLLVLGVRPSTDRSPRTTTAPGAVIPEAHAQLDQERAVPDPPETPQPRGPMSRG
jgi:hypothetical protein